MAYFGSLFYLAISVSKSVSVTLTLLMCVLFHHIFFSSIF